MIEVDLEMDRVISEIKKAKARTVCVQLPDGLKPKAAEIQARVEAKTDADVVIWAGSCFGACDVPDIDVDLLVQFGHSEWK